MAKRVGCDRCGRDADAAGWGVKDMVVFRAADRETTHGEAPLGRRPVDLCADCARALARWMDSAGEARAR